MLRIMGVRKVHAQIRNRMGVVSLDLGRRIAAAVNGPSVGEKEAQRRMRAALEGGELEGKQS